MENLHLKNLKDIPKGYLTKIDKNSMTSTSRR